MEKRGYSCADGLYELFPHVQGRLQAVFSGAAAGVRFARPGTPGSDYHEILLPISAAAARETVRQVWAEGPFDAVFCGTDLLAIGAIKGFNDIGVRVPDDVQIIGFDGIESIGQVNRCEIS